MIFWIWEKVSTIQSQNKVGCIDWGQQVKMDKQMNYIFKEFSYIFEDLFKEIR